VQKQATIGGWIYLAWFYTVLGTVLIVLYPLIIYGLRNRKRHFWVHRLRRKACRVILFLTGVRNRVYRDAPWPDRPVIYAANHTSVLDILVGLAVIPQPVLYSGKSELRQIPLFGRFFKYLDMSVERGNTKAGVELLSKAANRIAEGWSIVWFPEGTTSPIAPGLLKFKNGAFRLAVQAQVPVVPLTFVNHWHLQHYDTPGDNRPGKNRIVVGAPIEPGAGSEAVMAIKNQTRQAIIDEMNRWWVEEQSVASEQV